MNKKLFSALLLIFAAAFVAGCSAKKAPQTAPDKTMGDKPETMNEEVKENMTEVKDKMSDKSMNEYKDISVQEAKKMIDENPQLIVVDVSPKYAEGHLPGAVNYYVGDGSLDKAIPTLDKNVTYLVYCHVDSAAILGAQKLIDAGFENVYRMEGNYGAWVAAGYPVEK